MFGRYAMTGVIEMLSRLDWGKLVMVRRELVTEQDRGEHELPSNFIYEELKVTYKYSLLMVKGTLNKRVSSAF